MLPNWEDGRGEVHRPIVVFGVHSVLPHADSRTQWARWSSRPNQAEGAVYEASGSGVSGAELDFACSRIDTLASLRYAGTCMAAPP
jgi:hypothetical protein